MYRKIFYLGMLLLLVSGCRSQTKEELLLEGRELAKVGNVKGSIVLLRNALEKDPNYFEARYELAKAYLRTGIYERAEKEFQKVQLQGATQPELLLDLAELYLRTERAGQAIVQVQKYLENRPETAGTVNLLGEAYLQKQEVVKAEQCFRRAMQLNPNDSSPRLNFAALLMRRDPAAARDLLRETLRQDERNKGVHYLLAEAETLLGNQARALQLYRRLNEIDPDDAQALYMTGLFSLQRGELEEGEKIADELRKRWSALNYGSLLKGLVRFQKGDLNGAAADLQISIRTEQSLLGYYFLGLSYYRQDKLELALSQFQKMIDMQPDSAKARLMVATTLLKQQRVDDAVSEVKQVLQREPENGTAYSLLGSACMLQGKLDDAISAFDRATELDPSLIDAYLKKGLFHASRGDFSEAEEEIAAALAAAPEIIDTRLLLASHHLRQKNYAVAEEILKEGLDGGSSDVLLYNHLAAVSFALKNPGAAVDYLDRAKKASPDNLTPYYNLASYYVVQRKYDRALQEYGAVLEKNPADLKALVQSGLLCELAGKEELALTFFLKARETGKADGAIALAQYHLDKKRIDSALQVLEEAQKAYPNPQIPMRIGSIHERRGDLERSRQVYEELLKKIPGYHPALFSLGSIEERLGNRQQAEWRYREALKHDADFKPALNNLAYLLADSDNAQEALDLATRAYRAEPGNPGIADTLGYVLLKNGRAEEACQLLEKAAAGLPDNPTVCYHLALSYREVGKRKEASKWLKKALTLGEEFPEMKDAQVLLKKLMGYSDSQKSFLSQEG